MRFLTHIAILFYVLVISILGGLTIFFALKIISLQEVTYYLQLAYNDEKLSQIVLGVGIALIILSFLFAKLIDGSRQKEKTIAFDNPSGRVSVSLSAVEDLVKRLLQKFAEIKEVKPVIVATKRGLEIDVRLVLKADVNIPEMTSQIQENIKQKVQDIIGLEDNVTVRIHISKITAEEGKSKGKKKGEETTTSDISVPFQGYRS